MLGDGRRAPRCRGRPGRDRCNAVLDEQTDTRAIHSHTHPRIDVAVCMHHTDARTQRHMYRHKHLHTRSRAQLRMYDTDGRTHSAELTRTAHTHACTRKHMSTHAHRCGWMYVVRMYGCICMWVCARISARTDSHTTGYPTNARMDTQAQSRSRARARAHTHAQ